MTAATDPGAYRFDRFELQPAERRLLASGAPIPIGRHAFDVLLVLVQRSGHLVSKDQLLAMVWPRLVIEENTLQAHISSLRKVLGRHAIETVSGRGYRFRLETRVVAPVVLTTPSRLRNLPLQLTSFIGRESELADIARLLVDNRLLTLTGSGGCGKTRLALQVAEGQLTHPDGVWLVELAALAEPHLVPQTVAKVLAVEEERNESSSEALVRCLAASRLLLLLDNAEHLLAACVELSDRLLRACSGLRVLVTSREPLGLAGELTYRVPSLSVPDPLTDATRDRVLAHASACLFVERARLQRPHFAVTDENAAAVASICHRLDGIPLALELAAPRLRSMSVEEVSQRLGHRFSLLTGGSRTALPRHRTLRSLIDWSYDLLSEPEKGALQRLSVFSGGCTLDAAESVVPGGLIEAAQVLDLLTSLADKNLVAVDEKHGVTRFGLLETIRDYARERLGDSGEGPAVKARHLAHFLQVGEAAEPDMTGERQGACFERLAAEHDNLRSALTWSAAPGGQATQGLQLAGALLWYWYFRGYAREGCETLSSLLAASADLQEPRTRAKGLRGAGVLAYRLADYPAAAVYHEESLSIYRELGDGQGIVRALNNLGLVLLDLGQYAKARTMYQEALPIQKTLASASGMAILLNNLGIATSEDGDTSAARALFEQSLEVQEELKDPQQVASVLVNLAAAVFHQGDIALARSLLERCLALRRELGDPMGTAVALTNLGKVWQRLGDARQARNLLLQSLEIRLRQGQQRDGAETLEGMASVCGALDRPFHAARLWGAAERSREDLRAPMPPTQRPQFDADIASARGRASDPPAFDGAWREGRALSLHQATELALSSEVANAAERLIPSKP